MVGFNIGDRVEVVEPHFRDARLPKGTRGTVIAISGKASIGAYISHIVLLKIGRKKMFAFTEWLRLIRKARGMK